MMATTPIEATHANAVSPLLDALNAAGRSVDIPAGSRLFSPGQSCTQFLFLTAGTVRVQVASASGREIVLYRVHAGESCPMTTACLLGKRSYLAEGISETDIQGILLDPPAFERLLIESAEFRTRVFSAFAQRLADLTTRIEEVALERIDARLARFLLRQDEIMSCTHQDIATELGSAREVISRQLKQFEQSGWVALQRGRIQVCNRDALRTLGQVR